MAFVGDQKSDPFEITSIFAHGMLSSPVNPNGLPNSKVVKPWINGRDITNRSSNQWIIDFGTSMSIEDAAMFELPFEYVRTTVKPMRASSRTAAEKWWLHERPRPEMRSELARLERFICTPRVSKHRVFVWVLAGTVPDSRIYAFARQDDYFFGVLHSTRSPTRRGSWTSGGGPGWIRRGRTRPS